MGSIKKPYVWAVDDDPATLCLLKAQLSDRYRVRIFPDGVDAYDALFKEELPDVIVTDTDMPKMSGIKLIESTNNIPDISFVLVSGTDRSSDAQRLGVPFLLKPVTQERLCECIESTLQSRGGNYGCN